MSTPTYTKIQRIELGSAQTAITFSSIPSTYTDLVLKFSVRSDKTSAADGFINLKINTSTANFTTRVLYGAGSGSGVSFASTNYAGGIPTNAATSNTFGNGEFYFPNYSGGTNKSFSLDTVMEHNAATFVTQMIIAGLWSQTTAINSIEIYPGDATNFVAGSSATLYGIKSIPSAPKATGGIISYVNGYWVHTFTSSGTFTPTQNLSNVEYLVVAGGGGGGDERGGGGGAGGYRSSVVGESSGGGASAESRISLTASTNYTVTIGSGGAGGANGNGSNGGNSSISGSGLTTITATGGGGGGGNYNSPANSGGSGGGGAGGDNKLGNSGTANQGYAGGNGNTSGQNYAGGGGGGAGSAGSNSTVATFPIGGAGGAGVTSSITGSAIARAGGGGGAGSQSTGGTAVAGGGNGGGINSDGVVGTANTGGGGGASGDNRTGAAGGSGIVIIRYAG